MNPVRRGLLAGTLAWPFAGCRTRDPAYEGGWVGAHHERGHRLRDAKSGSPPAPDVRRSARVVVVGAGVAGLACARALMRGGVDDVHVLDLEDTAGGNSRGHVIAGMACPLGAHYLPVPGDHAVEVAEWLEELGVCRSVHGRRVYEERHLCHSPQERLFIGGQWQEGLLPVQGQDGETLAQYRRFAEAVTRTGEALGFALPSARLPWKPGHDALDAVSFAAWLDANGFGAAPLRRYLDYCCRDDYGAGAAQISAWAGLHYFASRHGFHAPGASDAQDREGVLTWPQGNAWLAGRLSAPLGERLHTGRLAWRVEEGRHGVEVDAWDFRARRAERWTAERAVLAVPLFVSMRLLAAPPDALRAAVAQMRHAPWLVASLHIERPLADAGGAAPAWDNVIHGSPSLGYVDAMHQSTRPHAGPTVLTSYWALGGDSPAELQANRRRLLDDSWLAWAKRVVADLATAHPDLPDKVRRVDLMRYGHAMSIPLPGVHGSPALKALAQVGGRVVHAHSDLSGYSVFEEAFFHGHRVGHALAPS